MSDSLSMEAETVRLRAQIGKLRKRNKADRKKVDVLYTIIIALIISVGVNSARTLEPDKHSEDFKPVVCQILADGTLDYGDMSPEGLKGKNVQLQLPPGCSAAMLIKAEDTLLSLKAASWQRVSSH